MNKVILHARGQKFEYNCPSNLSPVQAARNQFIPIPSGCIRGGCGMCKVKVTKGDYEQNPIRNHDYLSDEEMNNGYALACLMTAKSDLEMYTAEDYEALVNNEKLEEAK